MRPLSSRKGLLLIITVLLLSSLACLGGQVNNTGDTGNTGDTVDTAGTQLALESTQNALDVQASSTPIPPPTKAPDTQPDTGPSTGPAPFSLVASPYNHPEGLFATYPPQGWSADEDSGSTLWTAPDGSGAIYFQATNTGTTLGPDAFTNFVNAREWNWFGSFQGYVETEYQLDAEGGLAGITKNAMFNDVPQTIYTFYDQHDQAIFAIDFWADADKFDSYMAVYNQMLDQSTVDSSAAAGQSPFLWIYNFTGPANLFTMEVPMAFEYTHDEDRGDAIVIVDTFTAPDGHALIENVAYDDGEPITKSLAGAFALELLRTYYATDIKITDDQVQADGSERLIWNSPSGGYAGISFFESRGTTFLLLSLVYDNAYEDVYYDVLDGTLASYSIP
jgi:hypothetical protein